MERIGGALRAMRRQRRLTLREVERRSYLFAEERSNGSYRIFAGGLGRLERAEHKLTIHQLLVLAHIYGVPPEQLIRSMHPDPLARNPPPDRTTLLSPARSASLEPYRWGIIGKHNNTLEPLVAAGSVVQIDTRERVISPVNKWLHDLQRPIYFLRTGDACFCGWCELAGESLVLLPHPLSSASRRSWNYPKEIEIIGRVVAMSLRFLSMDDS